MSDFGNLLDSISEEIAGDKKEEKKDKGTFVGPADSLFAINPEDAAPIPTIVQYWFARHGQKVMREAQVRVKTYTKKLKRGNDYDVYEVKFKCQHAPHIVRKNGKHALDMCHCLRSLGRQRDKLVAHLVDEGHDVQKKQIILSGVSEYDMSYWWDSSKWMEGSVPNQ